MVSVIIPVYNAAATIRATAENILTGSTQDIELILVDDGSHDASLTICKELAATDSRVHVFHQENAGASAARNHGLRKATGEWLMFVDADDTVPVRAIEKLLRRTVEYPACDAVVGHWHQDENLETADMCWEAEPALMAATCLSARIYMKRLQALTAGAEGNLCLGAPWGKLIRRSVIAENNIAFSENMVLHEDTLFCMNLFLSAKQVIITNDIVYRYIDTPGSVSVRYFKGRASNMMIAIERVANEERLQNSVYKDACDHFSMLRILDAFKGNYTHPNNKNKFSKNKRQARAFMAQPEVRCVMGQYTASDIKSSPYFAKSEKKLLKLLKKGKVGMVVWLCRLVRLVKVLKGKK